MTHMHIPDGILPAWIWVLGFIIMSLVMGFSLIGLRTIDMKKKIPLLGALSATMLVGMSLPTELIIPGYHINLSVVTGILIGPALGFLAAFIANLILAFMGHGGITVIGLNTLLLGTEAVLGHTLFYLLKRLPAFWRAALATVVTLFVTTVILIFFVALSHLNPELLNHGDGYGHELRVDGSIDGSIVTFAVIVLIVGVIGWIIEAAITGAVVTFISQVKPDLLEHVLHTNLKMRDRS
jgi:cobalt/nickel transport system permease protein